MKIVGVKNLRVKVEQSKMLDHQPECIYQLVKCPKLHFDTKVPFHEILEHMKSEFDQGHDLTLKNEINEIMVERVEHIFPKNKFGDPEWDLQFKIIFQEKTFIFTAWSEDQRLNCWLQMVGSEYEAARYYYTLKIYGIDPNASTTFTARVIPMDETQDTILEKNLQYDIR